MGVYSERVACPCCGETMQFAQTAPHANLREMQTFECKPCGLVVTAEAVSGSMRPLIERRHYS
jgi:C4-type Zn-finger protein